MARPPAKRAPQTAPDLDELSEDSSPKHKAPSSFQLWFEDAWEGWVRPVGMIVLLAAAVLLYKFDLVTEQLSGALAVAVVLGGTIFSTAWPAWALLRRPVYRALFVVMLLAWAAGMAYPSMRAALPGRVLGEVRLRPDQLSAPVHLDKTGPYDVTVSGQFKSTVAEGQSSYTIAASDGSSKSEISGELKRTVSRLRTSRRGGSSTSVAEHNEEQRRLAVHGPDLTVSTDGVDEQLDSALLVQFRSGTVPPEWFWALGALALLLALVLDTMLSDGKTKMRLYLSVGMGISLAFSIAYPMESSPHSLVRPAVGELLRSLAIGGLGGWLLSGFTRLLFAPKPPKKAKKPRFTPIEN